MSLPDVTPIVSYDGNGSTSTAYPFLFKVLDASHVKLYLDGVLSNDAITVTGVGDDAGVQVTTSVAYASEVRVTLLREVPFSQETDLVEGGRLREESLEDALDYGVMQAQQLKEELGRTIQVAPGSAGSTLPSATNSTIGQDANGDLVSRTAEEQADHLGLGTAVTEAAASAAAAATSETNAATSETNAAASATAAEASNVNASAALLDLASKSFPTTQIGKKSGEPNITSDVTINFPGGGSLTLKASERPYAEPNALNANNVDVQYLIPDIINIINGDVTDYDTSVEHGLGIGSTTVSNFTPIPEWSAELATDGGTNLTGLANLTYYGSEQTTFTVPLPLEVKANADLAPPEDLPFVKHTVAQTLTPAQKEQTLANIEGASSESLSRLSLFASDHFSGERTIPAEIISRAEHCYFLDEAGTDYLDKIGGLDIPITGAANSAVTAGRFRESRPFDGSTQYGVSAVNTARVGQPFWFVVGCNFSSISGSDGVIGEGTSTTTCNWYLSRSGAKLRFYLRRKDTASNFDYVEVGDIAASTDYVIVGRNDSTGLYLYVSEVGEAYDNASLTSGPDSYDSTQYPFNIGRGFFSATAASAVMSGDIGFVAYGFGQLSERSVDSLTRMQAADFATLKNDLPRTLLRWRGILAVGDSLTTESFADPNWSARAATLHDATWRAEVSGIGGQTSTPITDRFLTYPLSNISRKVVAFWMGNNDPSNLQTVIDNVKRCMDRALFAGAEKVLILGLPNRSGFNSSQATVDALQVEHDFINAGFAALAATDARVDYLDVHSWFLTAGNYATTGFTLTADDLDDIALGIVPRQMRDTPSSAGSTHLGPDGADHLAYYVETFLP